MSSCKMLSGVQRYVSIFFDLTVNCLSVFCLFIWRWNVLISSWCTAVNVLLGFYYAIKMYTTNNFGTVIAILIKLIFVLFCFLRLPMKKWKSREGQFLSWEKK